MDIIEAVTDLVHDPTLSLEIKNAFGVPLPQMILNFVTINYTPRTTPHLEDGSTYDYIIVGAGAAGSVVAGRLAEKRCMKILLLEAGPSPSVLTEIPGISRALFNSYIDWKYLTVPQKHCGAALKNRQVLWPSGKAIGGSSVINAMLFVRGHRQVYDDWERLEGAKGWNYKNMLKYFKKLEKYVVDEISPEDNFYHGYEGRINAERPKYYPKLQECVFQAGKNLNFTIHDNNGRYERGFIRHAGTIRDGLRCSAAKAYLVPVQDYDNLDIVNEALVEKIIVENAKRSKKAKNKKRKKRAKGVIVHHKGKSKTIYARREVLVAAGTVKSAQLLLLSGIGPAKHLRDKGIKVHKNLPVGFNFQDHTASSQGYTITKKEPPYLNKILDPFNTYAFLNNRKGPYASTEAISSIVFLTNNPKAGPGAVPDQALYIAEGPPFIMKTTSNLKVEEFDKTYGYYRDYPQAWCFISNLHPKSRGRITLNSTDPFDPPNIDPNFYHEKQDLIDVATGLKYCDMIFQNEAFKVLDAKPFRKTFTECENLEFQSDEFYRCIALNLVLTLSHPAGTLKMGHPRNKTTVVAPNLKVLGFTNLRAVDASVMPLVCGGNSYVPTMAVAEKASDIIMRTIKDC